jgi:hypothetical protein
MACLPGMCKEGPAFHPQHYHREVIQQTTDYKEHSLPLMKNWPGSKEQ